MPGDHTRTMPPVQPPEGSVQPPKVEFWESSIEQLYQWADAVASAHNDLVDKQKDLHRRVRNLELYLKLIVAAAWIGVILAFITK